MKSVAVAATLSALILAFVAINVLSFFMVFPSWVMFGYLITGFTYIVAPGVYYDAIVFTYRAAKLNVLRRI